MEFNENKPIYLQLADQIMDDASAPTLSGAHASALCVSMPQRPG